MRLILLLLLVSTASAYAGEIKEVFYIENCENVSVEVFGDLPINESEYRLIDCSQNLNRWECECSGAYTLHIETLQNTLNNYTFIIDYWEYVEGDGSSSGGRIKRKEIITSCKTDYDCSEWSECVNTFKRRECKAQESCGVDFKEMAKCDYFPVTPTSTPTSQPLIEENLITNAVNEVSDVLGGIQDNIEQKVKDKNNFPVFAGVIVSLIIVIIIAIAVGRWQKKQYEE